MENVKTAVNLFVRLILCSYSRNIILNGYLLHRTTRFLLVVLISREAVVLQEHLLPSNDATAPLRQVVVRGPRANHPTRRQLSACG